MKFFLLLLIFYINCNICLAAPSWKKVKTTNSYPGRGETTLTKCGTQQICMVGGRGTASLVSVLDTKTLTWSQGKSNPLEMHHFQAFQGPDNCAWIVGAWTGKFPSEQNVEDMWKYCPDEDEWTKIGSIPRPRGAGGAFYYSEKVYLISGNVGGHNSDAELKTWFDSYDPNTKKWEQLEDIPHPRDHFHAVVLGNKLYVAGGRDSTSEIPQLFKDVERKVDVYDFSSKKWSTIDDFPRPRGGTAAAEYQNTVFVVGGEGEDRAWTEVDRLSGSKFVPGPSMPDPRHGTGVVSCNGALWIAGGARVQGGGSNSEDTYALFEGDTPPVCTGETKTSSDNTDAAAVGDNSSQQTADKPGNGKENTSITTPEPTTTPTVEANAETPPTPSGIVTPTIESIPFESPIVELSESEGPIPTNTATNDIIVTNNTPANIPTSTPTVTLTPKITDSATASDLTSVEPTLTPEPESTTINNSDSPDRTTELTSNSDLNSTSDDTTETEPTTETSNETNQSSAESSITPSPVLGDDFNSENSDNASDNESDSNETEPESSSAPACFTSGSTVELEDGSIKAMHELQIGDRVKVAHPATFSDVYFFSHNHPQLQGEFLRIKTSLPGVTLTVSPNHLIYANGELKPARFVRSSDLINVSDGHESEAKVTEIVKIVTKGLHNPHTIHGDIVVNGVVASTYTETIHPKLASILLLPFHALYRLVGPHDSITKLNRIVLQSMDYLVW